MPLRFLLVGVVLTSGLWAQSGETVSFQIRVQSGATIDNIENGGTIAMTAAAPRETARATVLLTYTGTGSVTFATGPGILGSGSFAASFQSPSPVTLQPQQSLSLDVRYTPTASARTTAQLLLPYSVGSGNVGGTVSLNMIGTAPEAVFATILQPDGNTETVSPGATLRFLPTVISGQTVMSVVVANRGSASLAVNTVAVSGDVFTAGSVPLLPTNVEPGSETRFNVRFAPTTASAFSGSLRIQSSAGVAVFPLLGTGTAAQLSYLMLANAASPAVPVGQSIGFADTSVSATSRVVVRIVNQGTAEARISTVAASGSAFSVAELPPLPIILAPGRTSEFALLFSPATPGKATGRLRIGDDVLDITGVGLGSQFRYTHTVSEGSLVVAGGGSVIFPAVDTGKSIATRFTITNTGTAAGLIPSIGLASAGGVFSLEALPPLPLSLDPGNEISVTLIFTPNAIGSANATLRIGGETFTLSGISNGVVPLPAYKIQLSDAAQPMIQPAVGITLDQPYPIAVSGTLVITGDRDAQPDDPAVQFATGGRTVNFRINPGSTQATFAGAQQVRMQTGSVAGVLTLTPAFATEGGTALTPSNVQAMRLSIPAAAPKLLNVQATAGENSLTLLISGYATTRAVRTIDVEFVLAPGVSTATSKFSINAEPFFSAWYQSSQSRTYGSQFLATIPFTLQRTGSGTGTAAQAIDSVSVRLSNEVGSSDASVVSLRTP